MLPLRLWRAVQEALFAQRTEQIPGKPEPFRCQSLRWETGRDWREPTSPQGIVIPKGARLATHDSILTRLKGCHVTQAVTPLGRIRPVDEVTRRHSLANKNEDSRGIRAAEYGTRAHLAAFKQGQRASSWTLCIYTFSSRGLYVPTWSS